MERLLLSNDQFVSYITESVMDILITEGVMSINDVYEKYYQDIPQRVFMEIVQSDPTYNSQKPDKMGKYTKWLLNLYRKNNLKTEDLYKAKEYLTYFNKFINKIEQKDINKYQSLPTLFSTIEPFINAEQSGEQVATSKSDEVRQLKKDVRKVYEDGNWLILIPLTKEAAIYYGKNTQWCTAAEKSNNMFDYYNGKGFLYINIDKRNNRKYQFHFEEEQFMDERDHEIREPILETIGMDVKVARQAYPNNYLTLEYGTKAIIGLNNGVYIYNDTHNPNGVSKIVDATDPDYWITIQEFKAYIRPDIIQKLDDNLFYFRTDYHRNSGIFVDTADKKVMSAPEYNIHGVYARKSDGKRIFYGTYKEGLMTGTVENGKLKGITNFRRTGMFDYLGAQEGDDPWDSLERYLLISRGQSEDVISYNARLYDIYDLETCKTVLSEVVYDDTIDSDNVGYIKGRKQPADGQSNPSYEYFVRFRKPIYQYEVDEQYAPEEEEYDEWGDPINEYDDDMIMEYAQEMVKGRPFYGVFEDTGEIWEMDAKNKLIRQIT